MCQDFPEPLGGRFLRDLVDGRPQMALRQGNFYTLAQHRSAPYGAPGHCSPFLLIWTSLLYCVCRVLVRRPPMLSVSTLTRSLLFVIDPPCSFRVFCGY